MDDLISTRAVDPPAKPKAATRRFRLSAFRGRLLGLHIGAAVILLLLLIAGAVWWMARGTATPDYTTMPAARGPIERTVAATGTVNPELTIIVGSYVSGVIQRLYCDYNTHVKAGQVCAKIDPRPYLTVVDQAKANLAVARAQLEKDRATLAYNAANYRRNRTLAAHQYASQDAADLAKSADDQAQAQVYLDEAAIAQRQAELDAAQVNLGYTDIISPVDGTVVSRNVTQGQTVAASFQTPTLFLIATDLTRMQVDTNVSESDVGAIKEGQAASFTVDAYPGRWFQGSVVQVRQSPQTVQNVVTFDAVVGVANLDLALMPGMTAATRFVTARKDDVLRVPNQALHFVPVDEPAVAALPAAGRRRVWVLREGKARPVEVICGLDDDTYTEVVGGDLHAGDQVIVSEQAGKSARPGRG